LIVVVVLCALFPVITFADVLEFSYSLGTLNGIGFSLVPELKFWKILVWFKLDFIFEYQEERFRLKVLQDYYKIPYCFDLNLEKGGVELSNAHFSFPFSTILDETENGWNFWTESFGMFVGHSRRYLYLKKPLIVIVGDDGLGEIGLPITIGDFGVIPFYTEKKFGAWLTYKNSGISITNESVTIRLSLNNLLLKTSYDFKNNDLKIGLGFYYRGNWLILNENSLEFRCKVEGCDVSGQFSKEGWRVQLSIPVW